MPWLVQSPGLAGRFGYNCQALVQVQTPKLKKVPKNMGWGGVVGPCNFSVSPWSKAFFFPFLGDFCSTWRSVGTLSGLSGPGLDKSCICVLKVTFKTKGQPAGTLTQPDRQTLWHLEIQSGPITYLTNQQCMASTNFLYSSCSFHFKTLIWACFTSRQILLFYVIQRGRRLWNRLVADAVCVQPFIAS